MSKATTNLGFNKPELTDNADFTQYNENWDKVDTLLHKVVVSDTLLTTGWLQSVYEWKNPNILSDSQTIELLPSEAITAQQLEALQSANLVGISQANGVIKLKAFGDTPKIDVPVVFIIRGDA